VREPLFLSLAEVIEIHRDQISRYGGQGGVRNAGLLESALAQPEASFAGQWLHPGLHEMAAAYAYYLCQNHPFVDGNKRTALACALVFLDLNGVNLLDPKGVLKVAMLGVAAGNVSNADLSATFKKLPSAKR